MLTRIHKMNVGLFIATGALVASSLVVFAGNPSTYNTGQATDDGSAMKYEKKEMENVATHKDKSMTGGGQTFSGEKRQEVRGPSFSVNPLGRVVLNEGEVVEAAWPNLKVKVWGVTFSVHVMPDAVIVGGSDQAQAAVGDKVDLVGEMEASGLIHARQFKNRTHTDAATEEIRRKIQQLMDEIERLRGQLRGL